MAAAKRPRLQRRSELTQADYNHLDAKLSPRGAGKCFANLIQQRIQLPDRWVG